MVNVQSKQVSFWQDFVLEPLPTDPQKVLFGGKPMSHWNNAELRSLWCRRIRYRNYLGFILRSTVTDKINKNMSFNALFIKVTKKRTRNNKCRCMAREAFQTKTFRQMANKIECINGRKITAAYENHIKNQFICYKNKFFSFSTWLG